jgi:hypothetical protein
MDRSLQYLFGGVASTALIAAAIAAFVSITALVANTNFPNGNSVQPPAGQHSVQVAEPSQPPASPIPGAAPEALQSTASSPAAVRLLASVGRALSGNSAPTAPGATNRHPAGSSPRAGSGGGGHSSPGGGNGSPPPTGANPSPSPSPQPAPSPGGAPPAKSGGGPTDTAPSNGNGPPSTPPGLASKPAGLPPGLAKKPGGTPPGLASKPSGTPPGLASKPGGLPPGQAKKG